jgi:hypothetical protein
MIETYSARLAITTMSRSCGLPTAIALISMTSYQLPICVALMDEILSDLDE